MSLRAPGKSGVVRSARLRFICQQSERDIKNKIAQMESKRNEGDEKTNKRKNEETWRHGTQKGKEQSLPNESDAIHPTRSGETRDKKCKSQ